MTTQTKYNLIDVVTRQICPLGLPGDNLAMLSVAPGIVPINKARGCKHELDDS
jgi:hypothetical protein